MDEYETHIVSTTVHSLYADWERDGGRRKKKGATVSGVVVIVFSLSRSFGGQENHRFGLAYTQGDKKEMMTVCIPCNPRR